MSVKRNGHVIKAGASQLDGRFIIAVSPHTTREGWSVVQMKSGAPIFVRANADELSKAWVESMQEETKK